MAYQYPAQARQQGHQVRAVHDVPGERGDHLPPVAVAADNIRITQRRSAVNEHVAALGTDVHDAGGHDGTPVLQS
jgi:hypothetical protein